MTPLVFKQHVPNVSEDTIGASGAPEGPISRKDSRFKDLVRNDNPNIIFRDEEGTKADRYMSKVSFALTGVLKNKLYLYTFLKFVTGTNILFQILLTAFLHGNCHSLCWI